MKAPFLRAGYTDEHRARHSELVGCILQAKPLRLL